MAITIKEIAKLAGVSRGTVDRALNNRGEVAPQIKAKILQIAADNNYIKNALASRLAKNESVKISIVIPNPEADPFWKFPQKGIEKIEQFVSQFGMKLKYHYFNLSDGESYCQALEEAILDKPKAILAAPVFYKESLMYLQIAQQNDIPFICINSEIEHDDILCYIGQNSYQSGFLAGKLFDLSNGSQKTIIIVTLGHDSKNASHITNKISGLKDYNRQNGSKYNFADYVLQDFENPKSISSLNHKIISEYKNIKGILFTNSRAYYFLNEIDFSSQFNHNITCIGFDLISQNIDLLEANKINFLLNQNPLKQGYLGIINLFNYFIYNKVIPKKQYLPVDVVFKENYTNYLIENDINLELSI